jgi:hypothetical protein
VRIVQIIVRPHLVDVLPVSLSLVTIFEMPALTVAGSEFARSFAGYHIGEKIVNLPCRGRIKTWHVSSARVYKRCIREKREREREMEKAMMRTNDLGLRLLNL